MRADNNPIASIEAGLLADLENLPVADRPGKCRACGHPASKPRDRRKGFLRKRPRAARCTQTDDRIEGRFSTCGCADAFHGS